MNPPEEVWNSLEIVKLIIEGLTPILILFLGIIINQTIQKFELRQWKNQKLIEKRLEIYDDISPLLNDLLCYFTFVGCCKDLSPIAVIKMKRILEKKIYLAAPLFSPSFFSSCMKLMDLCYETYTGWGQDAKLKTSFEIRKQVAASEWVVDWDEMYSSHVTDLKDINKAYNRIMKCFSEEIGFEAERK